MLMRTVGYFEDFNNETGEVSYERPMQGIAYPRFHIYPSFQKEGLVLKLHLDQKKPSYGSTPAHSGEYEGETVKAEAERIKTILKILKY